MNNDILQAKIQFFHTIVLAFQICSIVGISCFVLLLVKTFYQARNVVARNDRTSKGRY